MAKPSDRDAWAVMQWNEALKAWIAIEDLVHVNLGGIRDSEAIRDVHTRLYGALVRAAQEGWAPLAQVGLVKVRGVHPAFKHNPRALQAYWDAVASLQPSLGELLLVMLAYAPVDPRQEKAPGFAPCERLQLEPGHL